MRAEIAEPVTALLGEGPQLFPDGSLRWVDLLRGEVYVREAGRSRLLAQHPHEVSKVLPWMHGHLALTRSGIEGVAHDGSHQWTIELTAGDDAVRCSDGTVLPDGSVAVGIVDRTLSAGRGHLVRVLTDGTIIPVVDNATIPNGIDVTADGNDVLWVDSPTRTIMRLAIDPAIPGLGAPRPWITLPEEWGVPDGLCADQGGGVWVALWGGGGVVHITEGGAIDGIVTLAVDHVTSVAFDGSDALVITTASVLVRDAEGGGPIGAGSLWTVPFEVHRTRGLPPRVARLAPHAATLPTVLARSAP